MPGCGVHLILAARVLGAGPGSRGDPDRAAFFAGAIGPDMGYFPGGDRFASDLAHYVRAGRLVRALVRAAGARATAAFARGWATHVLADVLLHPPINRAVAELTRGPESGGLTFADDPVGHIRVEQGMDAAFSERFGASALWPGGSRAFIPPAVRLLAAAYRETYRFAPSEHRLLASCRAVGRGVPLLLGYGRVAVRSFGSRDLPAVAVGSGFAAARLATALVPWCPAYAFSRPCPPSERLTAAVLRVIDEFPARFAALEASGFEDLRDYNLDTGEPEEAPYAPAHATRERLRARSAQSADPAGAVVASAPPLARPENRTEFPG